MDTGTLKLLDLVEFNQVAERKFVRLVVDLAAEEGGSVSVKTVLQEAAYELDISVETAKRYLTKYSARRAPLGVKGGRVFVKDDQVATSRAEADGEAEPELPGGPEGSEAEDATAGPSSPPPPPSTPPPPSMPAPSLSTPPPHTHQRQRPPPTAPRPLLFPFAEPPGGWDVTDFLTPSGKKRPRKRRRAR